MVTLYQVDLAYLIPLETEQLIRYRWYRLLDYGYKKKQRQRPSQQII